MGAADLKVLYLVHDLADPAVHKRAAMLRDGHAKVTVAGFRRTVAQVNDVAGCPVVNMGRTYNGGFIQRIWSVLREVILLPRHREIFAEADIVIARNLEMLALAVRGRSLCTHPPILVYECLDIHRLLLGKGSGGISLRLLEGWLSKKASALITSSPAFVTHYFEARSRVRLPVKIVENKVYAPDFKAPDSPPSRPEGPPWRIGWFGIIRCRKSLLLLKELVKYCHGGVQVVIRGRPALDQIPDFDQLIAATPGLSFEGSYKNPDDLAKIYNDVHFSWSIDMYEEGFNSAWLLPNRLYEGGLYNTVPIALKSVETGQFIKSLGLGITLGDPPDSHLKSFFRNLTKKQYETLAKQAMEINSSHWRSEPDECIALIKYLKALK